MTEASDSGLPIQTEYEDMKLEPHQQFEMNKLARIVDSCGDLEALRKVTHQLLKAWFVQKSAVAYVMKQKLIEFSPIPPEDVQQQLDRP